MVTTSTAVCLWHRKDQRINWICQPKWTQYTSKTKRLSSKSSSLTMIKRKSQLFSLEMRMKPKNKTYTNLLHKSMNRLKVKRKSYVRSKTGSCSRETKLSSLTIFHWRYITASLWINSTFLYTKHRFLYLCSRNGNVWSPTKATSA